MQAEQTSGCACMYVQGCTCGGEHAKTDTLARTCEGRLMRKQTRGGRHAEEHREKAHTRTAHTRGGPCSQF
eukprot:2015069-Rhodomonas_salina.1